MSRYADAREYGKIQYTMPHLTSFVFKIYIAGSTALCQLLGESSGCIWRGQVPLENDIEWSAP